MLAIEGVSIGGSPGEPVDLSDRASPVAYMAGRRRVSHRIRWGLCVEWSGGTMSSVKALQPHQDFSRFFAALKDNPALFTGRKETVFRQGLPRWMSRQYRFTGVGSVFAGARWSVKGLMPTLYASTDLETLTAEAYYRCRRYGWDPGDFQPQLVVSMRWELQRVLDLTREPVRAALGVTEGMMLDCDWLQSQLAGEESVTQAVARAAFENLAEGLVVPSARRRDGVNLVYYPTHRMVGSVIETLKEEEIPFLHGLC